MSVSSGINSIGTLVSTFTSSIVKSTAALFMALAMVAFFYGIIQYIWGAREGDAKKIHDGNQFIIWSLVALFAMFSVYGIVRFGQSFICNGPCDNTITIPEINIGKSSGTGAPGTGLNGSPQGGTGGGAGLFAPSTRTGNNPVSTTGNNEPTNYRCVEGTECTTSSGGDGLWNASCTCVPYSTTNNDNGGDNGGGNDSAPLGTGADCADNSDCSGGLSCVDYKCR